MVWFEIFCIYYFKYQLERIKVILPLIQGLKNDVGEPAYCKWIELNGDISNIHNRTTERIWPLIWCGMVTEKNEFTTSYHCPHIEKRSVHPPFSIDEDKLVLDSSEVQYIELLSFMLATLFIIRQCTHSNTYCRHIHVRYCTRPQFSGVGTLVSRVFCAGSRPNPLYI